MCPIPAPERYDLEITIVPEDIDELLHVNNVVYVRWVQEAAIAHWRAAATPEQQAALLWVVARHEIDYRHAARLGDRVLARTWVGRARGRLFERHTELLRADSPLLLARALTLWCPIDPLTGRPTVVDDAVRERFSVTHEEVDGAEPSTL